MAGNSIKDEGTRSFLALPLGDYFLDELKKTIAALRDKIQNVKWTLPEQIHITLHFFGKISGHELDKIRSIVLPVTTRYACLKLGLDAIGFFPNVLNPRVVWIGVTGDVSALGQLRQEIETHLGEADFPLEERSFQPHATIGRVRGKGHFQKRLQTKDIDLILSKQDAVKTASRTIEKIILYKSILSPSGPRYEPLETFYLSQKPRA